MEQNKQVKIKTLEVGNIADVVSFRLITDDGDMYLNMSADDAQSMIDMLNDVVYKIKTGKYHEDLE